MSARKETGLMPSRLVHDPFTLMKEMTSELDRMFHERSWPSFRWPSFRTRRGTQSTWSPAIDVFERDDRLVTEAKMRKVEIQGAGRGREVRAVKTNLALNR
jgi:hypothetical protein